MSLNPPSFVDNPHVAYLWVQVKGQELTVDAQGRPRFLVGFSFNRITSRSGGSILQFTLFDETWDTAQTMLRAGFGEPISFQYGYTTGVKSPIYQANLTSCKPHLCVDGVELVVEGLSTFIATDTDTVRSDTYQGMDIHEVVQAIADRHGWATDLDPCDPVYDHHDLDSSLPSKFAWQQQKMRDVQFISEVLVPRSTRLRDHIAGYTVWFDDASNTLHFHPPRYEADEVATYIFMRDPLSSVQSFSPDIPAELWLKSGAGSVGCPHIDLTTGQYRDLHVSDATTPDKTILGGVYTATSVPRDGEYSVTTHSPASGPGQAKLAALDRYFEMWLPIFGADMTVQGEPQRKPFDIVRVIVTTRDGRLHETSGLYMIRNITDALNGGRFTSTFEMQRSGFPATGSSGAAGELGTGKVRQ